MKRFSALPLFAAICLGSTVHAAVLTVTNTADTGAGSLRQAMTTANSTAGGDVINFNIPSSDPNCSASTNVCTITTLGPLPQITETVVIDGYTQPGSSANTAAVGTNAVLLIELVGTTAWNGITISAPNCTIKGLVINRFNLGVKFQVPSAAAPARTDGFIAAPSGNHVEGCFIGTAPDGVTARGNSTGVSINGLAPSNIIGGATLAARNLISGNSATSGITITGAGATANQILNNLIGTTRTGNAALPNYIGVLITTGASSNHIGTNAAGTGNVISGNLAPAIEISDSVTTGTVVEGNFIGVTAAGNAALGNGVGVDTANGASGTIIGGTSAGSRNIISGNLFNGVRMDAASGAPANTNNTVQGNYIGTDVTGTVALGNASNGIELQSSASGNTIGGSAAGSGNLISGNKQNGIVLNNNGGTAGGVANNRIQGNTIANNGTAGAGVGIGFTVNAGTGNAIIGNSIFNNQQLGIDFAFNGVTPNDSTDPDVGPNNLQNFPVITSATSSGGNATIAGTLNSTPSTQFTIEFFANPACDASGNGEGQTFLGRTQVTTAADGNASFNVTLATSQATGAVTATATDPAGNTSEFSACLTAIPEGPATVQFSSATYTVSESAGTVTLTLTRSGNTTGSSFVHYQTSDGTAHAGSDYTARSGDLTFGPGETSKTFTVPITDDTLPEGDETFTATVTEGVIDRSATANGAPPIGSPSTATVTIVDNDTAPTPTPAAVQLSNISGRAFGEVNQKVSICGFIIRGGTGKQVIVRGLGPSLKAGNTPISGRMQDPMIELYNSSGAVILMNDDWRSTQETTIQQTGLAPTDNREAAIVTTLQPGAYTAILRAAGNSSGIGLVEVYELRFFDGEFANVSVRGNVLTGDNVLINGLILRGALPQRILFRALGPELRNQNITGELQDPMLEVYDENGVVRGSNDNWRDAPNASEIQASGIPPTDNRESAVLVSLSAGNYTAIVSGVNGTTGVGLAEAYKLNDLPLAP